MRLQKISRLGATGLEFITLGTSWTLGMRAVVAAVARTNELMCCVYSDYIESMRMGEKIAIAILEEQKLLFGENFYMSIELFDGRTLRI